MNNKRLQKYILKIKDSFLNETEENKKMLDIYLKYAEGNASEEEIIEATLLPIFNAFQAYKLI